MYITSRQPETKKLLQQLNDRIVDQQTETRQLLDDMDERGGQFEGRIINSAELKQMREQIQAKDDRDAITTGLYKHFGLDN